MSSTGVIEIGDLIDNRYQILAILGRGGMGTVYRAEHVGIRREVAIKIMHRELRGDDLINERLMREALATARMDHANCVKVTDSGAMPEGEPFLVMELLSGRSLGDELEERKALPIDEALHIAKQILKGLEHAHSLGIVHRDLKPDNIFLVHQDDAFPLVKILDFGIVKLQGEAASDIGGEDLTMAGMAIGSPVYMSPEQATGGTIDERSDLYSLSLVLYEMLNGEPPFYERNDKLQSLKRRLYEDPPPLVTADGHPISSRLEIIIHNGLGLRPEDRIATATEYLGYLDGMDNQLRTMPEAVQSTGVIDALMTGQMSSAAYPGGQPAVGTPVPPSPQDRVVSAAVKRKLMLAGAGALVVLFIGIVSFSGDGKAPEDQELVMDVEDLREQRGSDPEAFARRFAGELDSLSKKVYSGKGELVLPRLKKLQAFQPTDPLANRLLGLAFMEKRYWRDGIKHLTLAIELKESYRSDDRIIKAGLRSLTSKRRATLGVRFLVDVIGDESISYLKETAAEGGDRQREYALAALEQLQAK